MKTTLHARWIRALIVIVMCVIVVFPVYWLLITSITPEMDTFSSKPHIFPNALDLSGYQRLYKNGDIFLWMGNSLFVALSTAAVVVIIATLSGYCLSRFRFTGKTPMSLTLLLTQMLPEALLILPIYMMYKKMGLLNQLTGLILIDAAFAIPVGTWIMRNFFDTIPKELDEAASIDGCGKLSALIRVLVPSVLPSMAATAIIVFFDAWNEYLFSVTMVTKSSNWVSTVGLSSFIGMYTVPVTQVMAGSILFTVPSLLIYVVFQKYIISGLTQGAVKG